MNYANILSFLRILALPVIAYLIMMGGKYDVIALVVLVFALITDSLDGYLARRHKNETKFGSFLDPFADKLLVAGLLFFFFWQGSFPLLILGLFIFRDIIVSIIRLLANQEDISLPEERGLSHLLIYAQLGIIFSLILTKISYSIFFTGIEFFFMILSVALAIASIVAFISLYGSGLRERKKQGKLVQKEAMVILANSKSRGYHDGYRRRLLNKFAKRRHAPIIFLPLQGDIFKNVQKLIGKAKQVIIAGGDGTFESAVNCKELQKKSLGFFPLGAGNAFYFYFFKGKRYEYLRSRFQFREAELDVLEVEWEQGKRKTFFASVGLDAEVMHLSKERTQRPFRDYMVGSARVIAKKGINYPLECYVDSKRYIWNNCINLNLAKLKLYGYGFPGLVGKIKPDDGLVYSLALVNPHTPRLNKVLRAWSFLLAQLNLEKAPLFSLRGRVIEVKSTKPFPLQAGGEFLGYTKWIKVRVVRKQKVLMI